MIQWGGGEPRRVVVPSYARASDAEGESRASSRMPEPTDSCRCQRPATCSHAWCVGTRVARGWYVATRRTEGLHVTIASWNHALFTLSKIDMVTLMATGKLLLVTTINYYHGTYCNSLSFISSFICVCLQLLSLSWQTAAPCALLHDGVHGPSVGCRPFLSRGIRISAVGDVAAGIAAALSIRSHGRVRRRGALLLLVAQGSARSQQRVP